MKKLKRKPKNNLRPKKKKKKKTIPKTIEQGKSSFRWNLCRPSSRNKQTETK